MNIEIHQPRLEALIQQHMASGQFRSVEDLLLQRLEPAPAAIQDDPAERAPKQNLDEFLKQSPLWGSGLVVERQKDFPRPVEL
jgi:hypothetical protein